MAVEDPQQPDAEDVVRFVRMVSHGLRNPLAIATGMLDLLGQLAGPQLDDEARALLDRSSAAVRRTTDMVGSVQRYVAAQHRALAPVTLDLGELVAWAADQLDPAEAVVRVQGAMPVVAADRDLAEWAFHELFDNARRHAGSGPPVAVVVDAGRRGDRWLVGVADDGIGIAADRREEAFGEGERLGTVGGGIGLGLTMVRTVLDRHGGEAWLEAAPSGAGLRAVLAWPV